MTLFTILHYKYCLHCWHGLSCRHGFHCWHGNTVNMILNCWHEGWGGPLWERPDWSLKHPLESDCRRRVSRSIFKLNVARGCPGVFPNWMLHAGLKEYFQIECRTRVSRSIFKLNVTSRCQGVFSNWMPHTGVQEYFQIECRTRGSRNIFKLNVARGCPGVFPKLNVTRGGHGVFSNWLLQAGVQEYFQIECRMRLSRSIFRLHVQENYVGAEVLNTIEHYWWC